MKHILKTETLTNLPKYRPLVAMDDNGNLFIQGMPLGFVDLELPSGTLWSNFNLGATNGSTAASWYGGYYAWGEIEEKAGWDGQGTKVPYDWANYKYCNGSETTLTKYCPTDKANYWGGEGSPDGLTSLQDMDNVIIQTNKSSWNLTMPTSTQISELCNATYVTNEWVTNYKGISGLNGRTFTSKQNGKVLFIPAAGYRAGSSVNGVGSYCHLWSRSLYSTTPNDAYYLYFNSSGCNLYTSSRCNGFSARPVLVQ